ncbi:hypothetical protein ACHAWF_015652 [Thalassiosira exigua]
MKFSTSTILSGALLATAASASDNVRRGMREMLEPLYPDDADEIERRDSELFRAGRVDVGMEPGARLSIEGAAAVAEAPVGEYGRSSEGMLRAESAPRAEGAETVARAEMGLASSKGANDGARAARMELGRPGGDVFGANPFGVPLP